MHNEFSVYKFFPTGAYERVASFVPIEDAVHCAVAMTRSVGATDGTIARILITDGGDCTIFEWRSGEGVVWPEVPAAPPCG